MNDTLTKIYDNGLLRRWSLLALYILLLGLPCCLKIGADGAFHFAKAWLATGLLSAIFPATCFWLLACRYKWCNIIISSLLWALFFIDFYLFFHFDTRITDRILFLVLQTNSREAGEFLSTYILTGATLKAISIAIILAIVYIATRRYTTKMQWRAMWKRVFTVCLLVGNIASAIVLYIGTFTDSMSSALASNTLQGLYIACREVGDYSADVKRLEKAMTLCDSEIDDSIYTSDELPDVIFIIGESYNPNHSPLYGYRMMTTPGLVAERDKGNLAVFKDAVTPYPATGKVMEVLYSPADAYAGADRWDIPLVPSLFKHAGYTVTLHDNQCTRVTGDSKWDVGNCQFLNSNAVERATLDYRNSDILSDDLSFSTRELAVMQQIKERQGKPLFSIIHLYGQHSPANVRYPQNFSRFTAADYKWRKELSEQQASVVAEYDNATLYNDSVVCSILHAVAARDAVVVYLSDHGEEVHDFRNQYGRTMGTITKGIAQNIYRVPLMIYTSPEFRNRHSKIAQQIQKSIDNKIYTADIGQMLLYLGGIKTRWRDNSRNPLYEGYSTASRRILDGKVDYDSLMSE